MATVTVIPPTIPQRHGQARMIDRQALAEVLALAIAEENPGATADGATVRADGTLTVHRATVARVLDAMGANVGGVWNQLSAGREGYLIEHTAEMIVVSDEPPAEDAEWAKWRGTGAEIENHMARSRSLADLKEFFARQLQ